MTLLDILPSHTKMKQNRGSHMATLQHTIRHTTALVALLTTAAPDLGPGTQFLRTLEGPTGARKLLAKEKPDDWAAAALRV